MNRALLHPRLIAHVLATWVGILVALFLLTLPVYCGCSSEPVMLHPIDACADVREVCLAAYERLGCTERVLCACPYDAPVDAMRVLTCQEGYDLATDCYQLNGFPTVCEAE